MIEKYREKVALLIEVLPYVSEEPDLALHGGTAINLFVRDMPRLSVDIDLIYLPLADRGTSLNHINEILGRLKSRMESKISGIRVDHDQDRWKLIILKGLVDIKLEVNVVIRGSISDPVRMILCSRAQDEFEAFVEMPVIPFGQLYGGKICAALDRQHPRDLFDIKYLLETEGYSEEVRVGFIFYLVSSARPMHELLRPNFLDQRKTMENQFTGMSTEEFNYDEFENTREKLVETINSGLTSEDKTFLRSFNALHPGWSIYDFERFPAVQWKLYNLTVLKKKNNRKYQAQVKALRDVLD